MVTTGKALTLRAALAGSAIIALTAWGAPALADVFTWKDPQTGRTRMSNIPPPWLREPQPGQRVPKVEVIRENRVIDSAAAFAAPQQPAQPSARQLGNVPPPPQPEVPMVEQPGPPK